MYRRGIVSVVDPATCRVRVKWPDKGDAESWWLEVLQPNTGTHKDYHLPNVGELVAVLMDAKKEAGCVLGAIYTEQNKPPSPTDQVRRVTFGDGTVVEYNFSTHTLAVKGPVKLVVGEGASPVARADHVTDALTTLLQALSSAAVAPLDGGATFKTNVVAALGGWPPDLAATKMETD